VIREFSSGLRGKWRGGVSAALRAGQPEYDRNQTIAIVTNINSTMSEPMRRISPPSGLRLGAAAELLHTILGARL